MATIPFTPASPTVESDPLCQDHTPNSLSGKSSKYIERVSR